ncbi:hypothetical protein ES705_32859 [subsurface metagenome]
MDSKKPKDVEQVENISHTGKPLLLIGLNNLIRNDDNIFVIQYKGRVNSWYDYYSIFKEKLRIYSKQSYFITVDSFLDYEGNIFKPFVRDYNNSNDFNLTDEFSDICKKVFSKENHNAWSIPTEYIQNTCKIVFGISISAGNINSNKLIRILKDVQEIDLSFRRNQQVTDRDIISRYFFLKEIKRLQNMKHF